MRKISANYIYSPHTGFLKNALLHIDTDGRVTGLFPASVPLVEEANTEFYNGIICPGFINAHCHIELSHMQGSIPAGIGLDRFIYSVVTRRKSDQEEINKAILNADLEMQREGIVAVGDISNREDSFSTKAQSPIRYHTFVEIFNMVNSEAQDTFKRGLILLEAARNKYNLSASLTPHAPYSVSENLFELFRGELNSPDDRLSIHNQESRFENDFISELKGKLYEVFKELGMEKGDSRKRNMNSLKYLLKSIPEKNPLLLVHNVYTKARDMDECMPDLKKTFFCLCPNSNMYISGELPVSFLPDNYPENICLGTDSLSSNYRLSILEEMKTLQNHLKHLSLQTIIDFATLNGARALGLESTFGSFEKDKKPGVNLIENVDLQNLKLTSESKIRVLM